MLLKNGNAAEKIKTRNAATPQSSRMRKRSFLDELDCADVMEVNVAILKRRGTVALQKLQEWRAHGSAAQ